MPGYYWAYGDRSNSLLAELLLGPVDIGVRAFGRWIDGEKVFRRIKRKKARGKPIPDHQWRFVYERMKRRGLIEDRKVGDRIMIRLTDEGFTKAWRARIKSSRSHAAGPEVCVVIFDIPEKQKLSRDMFRYFLKQCGFKQLQMSVWTCPRIMAREVIAFVKHLRLERWVRVIEGQITL